MGNKPPRKLSKLTELSNFNSQNGDVYEEFQEIKNCCGIQFIKLTKKKLEWQNQFIKNCQAIKLQYRWANELSELVRITKLPRMKYVVEVNEIKKITASLIIPENEILLTPGEVQQFKTNLKKSVLLSYGQAKQQINQTNKITTTINASMLQKVAIRRKTRQQSQNYKMSIIKNQKPTSAKTVQSKSSLRKSIMTFVDDTISSVFGGPDKEISKQNAKAVENFLNFTLTIQKHMADQRNILCKIQKTFISFMRRFYSDPKIASRDIQFITTNIKQYLILMRQTLFDFYNLMSFTDQDLHALMTNEQNVLTVVTSILFKDKDFYQIIYNAVVEFNLQNNQLISQILQKLQGSTPQFFGINDQYCLNQLTLKKNLQSFSLESGEGKIDNFDLASLSKLDKIIPYKQCMDILRQMDRSKTPIGKMKIIMSCSQRITKCISKFYESHGFRSEHWVLDADQILSIFCYILANSKIPHIHSHLFLLQNFSTDHQLISVTGYYYSVLTCALEQIEMNYRELIA